MQKQAHSLLEQLHVPDAERCLIVAPIHGRSGTLDELVATVREGRSGAPRMQVVLAGNFIDYGPDSFAITKSIGPHRRVSPRFALKGPHEHRALQALQGDIQAAIEWRCHGGAWADVLDEEDLLVVQRTLEALPQALLIHYRGKRIGVVDTGFPDDVSFESGMNRMNLSALREAGPPKTCPPDLDALILARGSAPAYADNIFSLGGRTRSESVVACDLASGARWTLTGGSIEVRAVWGPRMSSKLHERVSTGPKRSRAA